MNTQVTGCRDCPFYDTTGDEYGVYCHHPKRKFDVEVSISSETGGIKDLPVLESEKDYYDEETKRYNRLSFEEMKWEEKNRPWRSIHIINEPIMTDQSCRPTTPDWCPLKQESIRVHLKLSH